MLNLDLATSRVGFEKPPVSRKRLESDSESHPSLEPSCDLSVSSDENASDPAPTSRTSVKDLPFISFSNLSTSCDDRNDLNVSTVVKELQSTKEKKVRFDTCTVRFMPLIAGDHPDCVEGPPVSFIVCTITSSYRLFSLCSKY
jgi:hypothetical protein